MTRRREADRTELAASDLVDSGSIVVWHVDLDDAGGLLDAVDVRLGLSAIGEREDERSERLPAEVRLRRRRARIVLRWVLLERHGVEAACGGPIERDEHGKPYLRGAPAFNVSHSGPICLVAVAGAGPVGVDVELPRGVQLGPERQALIVAAGEGLSSHVDAMRVPAVAGRPPPRSAASLPSSTSTQDDTSAFLTAWTRLEALAKARGDGVGRLLTALGITASGVRTETAVEMTERARAIAAADGLAVASLDLAGLDLSGGVFGAAAGPAALVAQGVVCRAVTAPGASKL